MIKINQNGFLFLVPPNFKQEIEVQCLAYAIDALFQKFIQKCACIAIWSDSTNWTHSICDQLAVELRTPLYSQTLLLETKKEMVKKTLDWYKKLGTAKVVKEVTALAWKSTGIEEWFQTKNRQPYTFRSDILPPPMLTHRGGGFSFDSTNVLSISELTPCVPRFL